MQMSEMDADRVLAVKLKSHGQFVCTKMDI